MLCCVTSGWFLDSQKVPWNRGPVLAPGPKQPHTTEQKFPRHAIYALAFLTVKHMDK